MLNFIITVFVFILLVTQKVLLLNEESLILLCFIIFVFLGINNLGNSVKDSLGTQSNLIKEHLTKSLHKLIEILYNLSSLNKNFKLVLIQFTKLKNYYKNLVNLLSKLIFNYNKYYLNLTYIKKLKFLNKTELQTIKLLSLIIMKKLTSIIKSKYFYSSSLKFNQFKSLNKIVVRECIQIINSRNKS